MNAPLLASNQTVGEVMRRYPQTVRVFMDLKLACIGCYLQEFCSLEYAARTHQVDLKVLLERLQEVI